MIKYLVNPVRGTAEYFASGRLYEIITPKQGNKLALGTNWAADNGAGPGKDGKIGQGYPGDIKFLEMLAKLVPFQATNIFAVAPDVLGDAVATLTRSAPMLPQIRALGYRAALVAQDGLEQIVAHMNGAARRAFFASFDVLFIGGSTDWKMGASVRWLIRLAKRAGKKIHFGRVNSFKRLSYANDIGADYADGTYLTYGARKAPLTNLNLPKALGWLDTLDGLAAPSAAVNVYMTQGYSETQARFLAGQETS